MFGGVVEEVGCVSSITTQDGRLRVTVAAERVPGMLHEGDPVSVNGIRLKVVDLKTKSFSADLACRRWIRTSFSRVREGSLVNLERAASKFDRERGRAMLRGRVDGIGSFQRLEPDRILNVLWLYVTVRPVILQRLSANVQVSVEGIKLRIDRIEGDMLRLALDFNTSETNLSSLVPGDAVNIEYQHARQSPGPRNLPSDKGAIRRAGCSTL